MIAPIESVVPIGPFATLLIAFALGLTFGFLLERGGLGDAPKLAGLFYLRDFTVLRVMFSAIVTALLGLFWCARLGLLDLGEVHLEATYVLPQLVGGLVFGVGFAFAGLCPGTSCVAAVTGKLDGVATMLGIGVGVLLFGETFSGFTGFLYGTRLGPRTLSDITGLPLGLLALAIVALALAAFALTSLGPGERPHDLLRRLRRHPMRTGNARLAAVALALAVAAAVAGDPPAPPWRLGASPPAGVVNGSGARYLDPVDLAGWIFEKRAGYRLVDLRPREDYDRYHIPGAEPMPLSAATSTLRQATTPDTRRPGSDGTHATPPDTLVVYTEDGDVSAATLDALRTGSAGSVYLLWGGMQGWGARVLFPDLARADALTADEVQRLARLSRFFGGNPAMPDAPPARGFTREGC